MDVHPSCRGVDNRTTSPGKAPDGFARLTKRGGPEGGGAEQGLGKHLIADLHGIDAEILRDGIRLRLALEHAARASGLRAVAAPLIREFEGGGAGVTGVILLAESHIAFHTYPERRYVALDAFTCGNSDPARAIAAFAAEMRPTHVVQTLILRGNDAS